MKFNEGMFREKSFSNKNYVITGGGSGLGKSMTQYLLSLDANVLICSRKLEKLEKAQKELEELTGKAPEIFVCDVREPSQVEAMRDYAFDKFGHVTGLVNNAAGNFISPTERLSYNAFDTIIDIVLKGTKNCTLAFGKSWIDKKQEARVLNIVTTYASTGSGYVVPSAAAKAGVLAMTKSLAVEWAKYGIRFNAIAPGLFPTKGAWERLMPDNLQKKFDLTKAVPLKRVGDHQELTNLVAYLLSDYAAFINGEVVTIDGGEWLQGASQFNKLDAIPDEMWDSLEEKIRSSK